MEFQPDKEASETTQLKLRKRLHAIIEAKADDIDANTATLALAVLHLAHAVTHVSDAVSTASDEISTQTFDGLEVVGKALGSIAHNIANNLTDSIGTLAHAHASLVEEHKQVRADSYDLDEDEDEDDEVVS